MCDDVSKKHYQQNSCRFPMRRFKMFLSVWRSPYSFSCLPNTKDDNNVDARSDECGNKEKNDIDVNCLEME